MKNEQLLKIKIKITKKVLDWLSSKLESGGQDFPARKPNFCAITQNLLCKKDILNYQIIHLSNGTISNYYFLYLSNDPLIIKPKKISIDLYQTMGEKYGTIGIDSLKKYPPLTVGTKYLYIFYQEGSVT